MYTDAIFSFLLLLAFLQLAVVILGKLVSKLEPKPDPLKLINQDRVARGLPPLEQLP